MHSGIFTGVQIVGTWTDMRAQWTNLLLFLLKLVESDESCPVLSIRYLRHLRTFGDCIKRIQTLGAALLTANPMQLARGLHARAWRGGKKQ